MPDIIVLDLETQKTFDEVGGHHNSHKLGVSLVGVYSYGRNEYRGFREAELPTLLPMLKEAELIVGFNSKKFDFTVLQPYFKGFDLVTLPHLDILEEVMHALGYRLKLETLAQATLGYGKSGDGLDAIRYYRAGDFASLEKYCLDDVKVTKELYDYGAAHGHLWFTNNGKKESMVARWAKGETITDMIRRALSSGLQLEIDYWDDDGIFTTRRIDVQSITNDKVKAYCHLRNAIRIFDLAKIRRAATVGTMASFQEALL